MTLCKPATCVAECEHGVLSCPFCSGRSSETDVINNCPKRPCNSTLVICSLYLLLVDLSCGSHAYRKFYFCKKYYDRHQWITCYLQSFVVYFALFAFSRLLHDWKIIFWGNEQHLMCQLLSNGFCKLYLISGNEHMSKKICILQWSLCLTSGSAMTRLSVEILQLQNIPFEN